MRSRDLGLVAAVTLVIVVVIAGVSFTTDHEASRGGMVVVPDARPVAQSYSSDATTHPADQPRAFVHFAIADLDAINTARLRIYGTGKTSSSELERSIIFVPSVSWSTNNSGWREGRILRMPASTVGDSEGDGSQGYYDLDVTAYVRASQASGSVSFGYPGIGDQTVVPELVIIS